MRYPKPWFRKGRGWFIQRDGKQVFLGVNREEAKRRYHELMTSPPSRQSAAKDIPREFLFGLIKRYVEYVQNHRAPDTAEWYRFRLQRFIDYLSSRDLEGMLHTELRPFHVQEWIDSYPKLSAGSKRNYARAIMRCMTWAEEQALIDRNPIRHFKKPRGGKRNVVISPEEYERILGAIRNESFRDLVMFTWETGARAAECLAIEHKHVELANHRAVFPVEEEKMEREPRVVYFSDKAEEIIQRRLLKHPMGKLFQNTNGTPWTTDAVNCAFLCLQIRLGKERLKEEGFTLSEAEISQKIQTLNATRRGNKGQAVPKPPQELREEAIRKLTYAAASRKAPKYCLTHFRHSFCHRLLKRKVDALTVAALLGHANGSSMVAEVYSHLNHASDYLLDTVRKFG